MTEAKTYTVTTVAIHYGVSTDIVRRWIKTGDLPSTRGPWMGTNYLFTEADLDALERTWAERKAGATAS